MKYALNLEAETLGDYSELDEFEEEATDSFFELDEYSDHECESCAEFDPEFDEMESEAEIMRSRRMPQHPVRVRPGMRRPRPRPRVVRRPGLVVSDPSICTCPAQNCPQHGSEYVRWVQSALNQAMNLHLPVTGMMDAATRSALRSFQQRQGLPVDGIAGPETKEALIESRRGKVTDSKTSSNLQEEFDYGTGEMEWEESAKVRSTFRYVKNFASSDADCVAAMNSAKKTRSQALAIINAQIGQAIRLLRVAANKLKRGNRSTKTKAIFQKIFRVTPEFVPTWLKQTATIKDRGDVVATRCLQVANLLERGGLRYFCTINSTNCPDCSNSKAFACSSWGDDSISKNNRVVCLGERFWKAMGENPIDIPNILAVLMHEPFHVYYGKYVTEHQRKRPDGTLVPIGKFGGIYCTTQFVFEINGKSDYPARMKEVCEAIHVRR